MAGKDGAKTIRGRDVTEDCILAVADHLLVRMESEEDFDGYTIGRRDGDDYKLTLLKAAGPPEAMYG